MTGGFNDATAPATSWTASSNPEMMAKHLFYFVLASLSPEPVLFDRKFLEQPDPSEM